VPRGRSRSTGSFSWLQELVQNARLTWRLLRDPRLSPWVKLVLPGFLLLYLLMPLDLLPDLFPLLGQMDDLLALLLAGWLFINLAPRWIVEEHQEAIRGAAPQPRPPESREAERGPVIEARYRVVGDSGDGPPEGSP